MEDVIIIETKTQYRYAQMQPLAPAAPSGLGRGAALLAAVTARAGNRKQWQEVTIKHCEDVSYGDYERINNMDQ